MKKFLSDNSKEMKLARTIVQGLIAVVVANIDVIAAAAIISPVAKPIVVAIIMAILTPLMAALGENMEK